MQVTIVTILGEPVGVLFSGQMTAGAYHMPWDGNDAAGRRLPSGTYWYRIQSDNLVLTKKLLLLK